MAEKKTWNLDNAKEPTTIQVLKWALGHWHWITLLAALIGAGYRFESQWQEHVAPNCAENPQASACRVAQIERKMDRMEQTLDTILLRLPEKRR